MAVRLEDFARARVIPVVRTATQASAERAVDWLADCGFQIIEMTLTTPGADAVIAAFAGRDGLSIGAGTVLTAEQARRSAGAGADFLVSPALCPPVSEVAHELGLPCFLGAATPSEVLAAHNHGATGVKLFPAAQLGGPAFLKAIKSVFPSIALMPTGGIAPDNAREYLDAGAVCVGMGGKLVDESALLAGDPAPIRAVARQTLAAVN